MRRALLALTVMASGLLALPSPAHAGFDIAVQLMPSDARNYDSLGQAVALDGDTAAVSIPNAINQPAAVYVYTRSGATWTQTGKLVADPAAPTELFGWSVAVSGNTIVVGSPNRGVSGGGSAYVFTESAGAWTQSAHLMANDAKDGDRFGWSVGIDGGTIVVGAPEDDTGAGTDAGSAYVFTRSGGTWTQASHAFASDGSLADNLGESVGVSDGTIAVGAPSHTGTGPTFAGAVYVFTVSGNTWTQSSRLVAADASTAAAFGHSVAISGGTIAVGASGDTTAAVANDTAYVFTGSGATWTQAAHLVGDDVATADQFGSSIGFSGAAVVVGSPNDDTPAGTDAGSAYVFTGSGSMWTQSNHLVAPDGTGSDKFGYAVATSGGTVIAGVPYDDTSAGADTGSAWLFSTATLATAPQNVQASADVESATVTWADPSDFGNGAFTRWEVLDAATSDVVATVTDQSTHTANVTGLTTGTAHSFKVRAVTANGNGASSAASNVVYHCHGEPATRVGSAAGGAVTGTSGDDVIVGLGGNDVISGGAGNDTICGGNGNDTIAPGAGNDLVDGGVGTDGITFADSPSAVTFSLNTEAVQATGGSGSDSVTGVERLTGSKFGDRLIGSDAGANVIWGGAGNDKLYGLGGDDVLLGDVGNDVETGGPGADTFRGGTGIDTVTYGSATAGVKVTINNLADDGSSSDASRHDNVRTDVENVIGSKYNDTLVGYSNANRLTGGAGADYLSGLGGNDLLVGGTGIDKFYGGAGNDYLAAKDSTRDSVLSGGTGTDAGSFDATDPARVSVP